MKLTTNLYNSIIVSGILFLGCDQSNNINSEEICNSILEEDITLETQSDLEEFATNNYKEVTGELRLSGFNVTEDPIINVSSLTCLNKLGSLIITNLSQLTNLQGLNELVEIDSDLIIHNTPNLSSLQGLESLIVVGGDFRIRENHSLIDLRGLENLNSVSGTINISSTELENIETLSAVNSILKSIIITNNNYLTNLEGLNNISTLTGGLTISNNDLLEDISALTNLTTVSLNIDIMRNPLLRSINPLRNISSSIKRIDIYSNNNLETINFNKIKSVISLNFESFGHITIEENPSLTSLGSWDNLIEVNNYIRIWDNVNLIDFCGLQSLLQSDGLTNEDSIFNYYDVIGNSFNPTEENIINGNCSL